MFGVSMCFHFLKDWGGAVKAFKNPHLVEKAWSKEPESLVLAPASSYELEHIPSSMCTEDWTGGLSSWGNFSCGSQVQLDSLLL